LILNSSQIKKQIKVLCLNNYKYLAYIRCENSDCFYIVDVAASTLRELKENITWKLDHYKTADPECYKVLKDGQDITSEVI
jgi:hypothetical protein